MLATWIHDEFSKEDLPAIASSLDEIASPEKNYGWASAGVYCFWSPEDHRLLYTGLAVDLSQRFRQHSGLISHPSKGCKIRELESWFADHNTLGYTIMVQSALSQPVTRRFNLRWGMSAAELEAQYGELVTHGHEAIVEVEGLIIEAYRLKYGKLPPWNRIGGSRLGARKATMEHAALVDRITCKYDDWSMSRSTIRELAQKPTLERWEGFLHGVRLYAVLSRQSFGKAFREYQDDLGTKSEILESDYLPQPFLAE